MLKFNFDSCLKINARDLMGLQSINMAMGKQFYLMGLL